MKAIVCSQPMKLRAINIESRGSRSGRAIIKIKRIGICGTGLHAFEGTQPYFSYPKILGHEISGEIVDIDHHKLKVGQPV
jgi:threonine dehydrogenase-like Zn-dependent dehydrogenase